MENNNGKLTEFDLYYIAGFFDGEGTATVRYVKAHKNKKRYKRLEARIAQKDPTILYWLQSALSYGRVQRKYDKRTEKECYDYVVYYAQARKFLTMLEPYMRHKREHVKKCLKEDKEPRTGFEPTLQE